MTEGIHNIPEEEYHADPCPEPSLSRSTVKALLTLSPAHVFHGNRRLNPDYVEPANESKFDIGNACHALLLEGEDIAEVVEADSWRTKAAKEKRDEIYAAGRTPLLPCAKTSSVELTHCGPANDANKRE